MLSTLAICPTFVSVGSLWVSVKMGGGPGFFLNTLLKSPCQWFSVKGSWAPLRL